MFETLIRKATPIIIALFTMALTVGTAFAQDGESTPASSGLTVAVLVLGASAIAIIFLSVWSGSAPDDND